MLRSICFCLTLTMIAPFSFPGDFKLENGSFTYHQASQDLESDMKRIAKRKNSPTYFAYKMASVDNYHVSLEDDCQWNLVKGSYESGSRNGFHFDKAASESPATFSLIFSYKKGAVDRIALMDEHCVVNGEGETIHWFNQVSAAASIRLLADAAIQDTSLREEAFAGIAMHDDALAVETLLDFSQPSQPHEFRKTSIFWLGQVGKQRGLDRLIEIAAEEQNVDIRKHLNFVFSIHNSSQAKDTLKDMALNDSSDEVRANGFFWMAQSGHPDAEQLILQQLDNEPSQHFLSQAGFMLSQLPDGRGTAHLERFVVEGREPELRKQALFWLGQGKTEAALETVLRAIDNDEDVEVGKHAVFVLSQFDKDVSLDPLLNLAQNHANRNIRKAAMFWLGQKAGEQVKGVLKESAMNDGDLEVMEHALMGLSQMQGDSKVTTLIEVASEHKNARIRKKAVFWISQSDDPRALNYIKSLLLDTP